MRNTQNFGTFPNNPLWEGLDIQWTGTQSFFIDNEGDRVRYFEPQLFGRETPYSDAEWDLFYSFVEWEKQQFFIEKNIV